MKEKCKELDGISQRSEISNYTDLKVFKPLSKSPQEKHVNNIFKLSTEPKNDSTAHSTLKSERDKQDSLSLYLKEGKQEKKMILKKKMDSRSELQKVVTDIEEEVESYSMKSDKVEEFPLSFRPIGLAMKDSKNELNKINEEKNFTEMKKYEFLEDTKEDISLNNFAEDFYIDPELEAQNEKIAYLEKDNKENKNYDCDSIKDLVVTNETTNEIQKKQSKIKIDSKSIMKNLAANSYRIENKNDELNPCKEDRHQNTLLSNSVIGDKQKNINNLNVEINCCLSRVEKGNAIFVTNQNQIFKLPRLFLPMNYYKGNSFKISFEETEKSSQKYEKVRYLQNKYFFK